jgi:serine/threonine protein kinase
VKLERVSSNAVDSPGLMAAKLPLQIVDHVSERVCLASVIVASTTVALVTLAYFLEPTFALALERTSLRLTIAGLLLASVLLFLVQRYGWLTKPRILDLTLVYQVVVSFAIGMIETTTPWYENAPVRGLTFLGLWFFVSAFLLPNAPLRMAAAAAVSILSWLAAYWLNVRLNGVPPFPANQLGVLQGQMVVTGIWMLAINRRAIAMHVKQYQAEQLGSYELVAPLGQGGMGEVWKARHKMLSRESAIKLIRPDVLRAATGREESALLKRFEREARSTARLRSPHTVALYDYGRARDGTLYYVMELLHGIDLQTLVERFGPLHPGRVRNILIQVCESLEEAHQAGLVHRDIKPRNILLAKLGLQYDFAKVLDFGLVKINQAGDQSTVTVEGVTAGTPAYLAPEIALGQNLIDGRADLYSLGCVAYFLLTGRTVFDEASPVAHAIAHVQSPVIPPSQRAASPVPRGLEEIVLRLLAKRPEERFQSAYELARALRNLKDVPEFCPYTAADWWNTYLPETIAAASASDGSPLPAGDSDLTLAARGAGFSR